MANTIKRMSSQELAKALRFKLAEKFVREKRDAGTTAALDSFLRNLKGLSDEAVIAGYLKCSVCGRTSMTLPCAIEIAQDCRTADEWVGRLVACERLFGGCYHDINSTN